MIASAFPATLRTALASLTLAESVELMRSIAIRALKQMYLPKEGLFAFRIRRTPDGNKVEGLSRRYTAIALLGLRHLPADVARDVLAGQTCEQVCERLLADLGRMEDLGEVALTAWAARALDHAGAAKAVERLRDMRPVDRLWPTVETAWSLAALTTPGSRAGDDDLAGRLADLLIDSHNPRSRLFPHWPLGAGSWLRSHVSCFADQVYPIQALSHHHERTSNPRAIAVAGQCARRICELQGAAGQWWWHYDYRTGRVVERYPVYAIHQDAMGPMALFALQDACGEDHSEAVARSVEWLVDPPELGYSLIDPDAGVIWRKVARREALKLVRRTQILASRVHSRLRMPAVDRLFPAVCVDWESRPYHMGWLLHAWAGRARARAGVREMAARSGSGGVYEERYQRPRATSAMIATPLGTRIG